MQYKLTLVNTGSVTTQVEAVVDLIAPDNTVSTLLNTSPTLTAGQTKVSTAAFQTSTYTSQVGTFTLCGVITDPSSGEIIAQQNILLTITAAPPNLIYASVGGFGPDTASLGFTYDFSTVVSNLSSAAMNLQAKTTLVMVNGSEVVLNPGALKSIAAGSYLITPTVVNTTQYSASSGAYSVRLDVLDSNSNILATDTHTFTRNALAASTYVPTFTDTAISAGVSVSRAPMVPSGCGPYMDQIYGGAGASVADYDNDGFQDIFVTDMSGNSHLWHNNGNGTYTDMAAVAGIPLGSAGLYASGSSFADVDNDGWPDLLVLFNGAYPVLLHNNQNGTFTQVVNSGLNSNAVVQNEMSATWGDYDGDGYLDLYVVVHADCSGTNQNDHLYHNNGNLTFTDVTALLGGSSDPRVTGRGLVAAFIDYNNDGRVDLYVGNDEGKQPYSHPNVLWRNDGSDGKGGWIFTDVSSSANANIAISTMGFGFSDYNRTGRMSIFATNWGNNYLLQQQAGNTFIQQSGDGVGGAHVQRGTVPLKAGGVGTSVTWGTGFYDFNNDGWEDLYIAGDNRCCGTVLTQRTNALFLNNQDGTFLDLSILSGVIGLTNVGGTPGVSFADFDNDGFMDMFEAPNFLTPHLYMNQGKTSGNPNNWLKVKLFGSVSNRDGVGARLVAVVGGASLVRWVTNGGGYQGSSSLIQHFGLGSATAVDSLTVYWPSGKINTFANVAADQVMTITEQ